MTDVQITSLCETTNAEDITETALLDVGTANHLAEIFKALSEPDRCLACCQSLYTPEPHLL